MASKYSIKRLEQQKAKVLEAQATIDPKIQEAEECKCQIEAEKATKKVKKEEEKRVRLLLKQQEKVEKKPKAPAVGGPSNKSFYPVYQKVMMRLAVEFITRMKVTKVRRCLLRARNTVFWPKMTYDIQQLRENCMICQEYGKSQIYSTGKGLTF